MPRAALSLLAGVLACGVLAAQDQAPRARRTFRTGIEVTSVNVTVLGADGRLVHDLAPDAFEIFEDGEPQTVTQFIADRVPVSLGIALDTSDSMFGVRLVEARAALERFMFDLLDRDDEFFVMAFNHAPHLLTDWTADPDVVRPALDGLHPSGATAAYDAILASLPLFERRNRPRAALLVISDGADTASDATVRDVNNALFRSDAFVYAIAIDGKASHAINTRVNPQTLRAITEQSGGRTAVVMTTSDLQDATARIAEELRSQYLLGYTSTHGADGRFHSIRVRVRGEGFTVRARHGYVAGLAPRTSRPAPERAPAPPRR